MKYQYILLDIDSTLIDFKGSFDNAAREVLTLGQHPVTPESVEQYFQYNDAMWFGLGLHEIERQDIRANYHQLYWKYIHLANQQAKELMGLNAPLEDLIECFMDNLGRCAIPMPNAVKVCKKLAKTHTLCVATNGLKRIQPGKLKDFHPYLTHTFISEELGRIKPEKEYFDQILEELGCSASQCLMVGDSLANDIQGARVSGMDSCFYNPLKLDNTTNIRPTYEIHDFSELLEIVEIA